MIHSITNVLRNASVDREQFITKANELSSWKKSFLLVLIRVTKLISNVVHRLENSKPEPIEYIIYKECITSVAIND